MKQHKASHDFLSRLRWPDVLFLFILPLLLAVLFTIAAYQLECVVSAMGMMLNSVPIVSSIIMGFVATILVASLSEAGVFLMMKNGTPDHQENMYPVFVSGLYFNLYVDILLLAIIILCGPFIPVSEHNVVSALGVFAMAYLLLVSLFLFVKNMNRLFQVICYINRK